MSAAHLLIRFMLRYRGRVALGLFMGVAGTLLGFVFPGVAQWFIDDIIPRRRVDLILPASLLALGAFALRQLFYSLRTVANNAFELRMTHDLRSQLHEKIQHLPLKWFDRQSTGDVITRMADDVPATQRVILDGVDQAVPAVLQALICLGVMFFLHWKLALVTVLPLPLIAAGGWIYSRWVSPRASHAREAAGGLNSLMLDNISGIRQIKSYTLEDERQRDFDQSSDEYRARQTRLQRAWALYGPGMGFLGDTGVILLMGFGAWWAVRGEITIGQLSQFLLLIGMLYEPIGRMHGINQTFVQGTASARRIFDILSLDDAENLREGRPVLNLRGEIIFSHVNFRYDASRPTLEDVCITVKPQQTVAFVGATGSGKSTLFQLFTRLYEASEGAITLDGVNIKELNKASLRDHIGYVTQESYLFNQTVRENLRLAKPDATDAELWHALELACAKEFVERMDGGLDAAVGERGSRLSGGEKQRISIARAFLKDAPVLLLDEATSAVDAKSEKLIQQAIDRLRNHRTCLVIAHRLSTIRHADRIYVMRQGRILAQGTHDELVQSCEYYAELAKLSFTAEKLEE